MISLFGRKVKLLKYLKFRDIWGEIMGKFDKLMKKRQEEDAKLGLPPVVTDSGAMIDPLLDEPIKEPAGPSMDVAVPVATTTPRPGNPSAPKKELSWQDYVKMSYYEQKKIRELLERLSP